MSRMDKQSYIYHMNQPARRLSNAQDYTIPGCPWIPCFVHMCEAKQKAIQFSTPTTSLLLENLEHAAEEETEDYERCE